MASLDLTGPEVRPLNPIFLGADLARLKLKKLWIFLVFL